MFYEIRGSIRYHFKIIQGGRDMASFEMYPREAESKKFASHGGSNASLAIVAGPSNSVHVALRDGVWGDQEMDVDVQIPGGQFIKIEPAFLTAGDGLRIFRLTGQKDGIATITASVHLSSAVKASLSVLVKSEQGSSPSTAPKAIIGGPLANFEAGFIEGLYTANGTYAAKKLAEAVQTQPGRFAMGYADGVISGLWAGVKDLVDGLAALGSIAPYVGGAIVMPGVAVAALAYKLSDREFRKKIADKAEWAQSVAEAAKRVVVEFEKDKTGSVVKYLAASKDAGRKVGEAFATEIDNRIKTGDPILYGQWIGWAVGRIAFEIIVLLVTEGIGDAVKAASVGGQGLKGVQAVGEAAELFARIRGKLQEVLKSLPALESFVKTLTRTKSAAEAGALAKAITEAAEAAARASKAVEAAKGAAGTAEAAEAIARAEEAVKFAEAAKNAKTPAEAAEAAAKAKTAAEAAEQAAAKAKPVPAAGAASKGTVASLQLDTVSGINSTERTAMEALDEGAWTRINDYAKGNKNVYSVKGKIAEEVFRVGSKFTEFKQQVLQLAKQRGIPDNAIRFIGDASGRTPTRVGMGSVGELTDGMFVAEHEGKLHVLGVIESKSPSNLGELAAKKAGGKTEFLGQLEWDFERLKEVPTKVGEHWYQPENVVVSRRSTAWMGVTPAEKNLSKAAAGRIQAGLPNFSSVQNIVRDEILNEISRRILALK
ncbi:hypothetical protein [Bradyrhizobium sp. JYMT SZCCT0428]|uniref:hypothetical protein n=1 Tax=Bradyrhizobium sp. JYMT SZCCT0428 TaxID=2807673 RepID=UPI001BA52722|nr:hypothetical protein [Bradyrhizobium sp. JYMT SZCCT0428]MBR1155224.1 hypothetical protein [Bradyrhizobium sp. JYMT SZCCT0428]